VDFRAGEPYATFGYYRNRAAEPNRDPRWTTLIQFDSRWRRLQAWIYVLRFPQGGSTLLLEDTFGVPNRGQGIALDPSVPDALYSIDRANREVIVARVRLG
jgi:hypothetical protein